MPAEKDDCFLETTFCFEFADALGVGAGYGFIMRLWAEYEMIRHCKGLSCPIDHSFCDGCVEDGDDPVIDVAFDSRFLRGWEVDVDR